MFDEKTVVLIYTLTPLHAGSGSSLSIVDLPVQREVHTHLPIIQASEIKGVLRDYYKEKIGDKLDTIFGPKDSGSDYSSCISIQDARILLFPVKSAKGVFAYTTSPAVINSFLRDTNQKEVCLKIEKGEAMVLSDKVKIDSNVVLEEFTFESKDADDKIKEIFKDIAKVFGYDESSYIREGIMQRVVILEDDIFREFTKNFTEVVARTQIDDETGTVKGGALWYEENVPRDTLFYSVFRYNKPFNKDDEMKTAGDVKKEIESNWIELIQIGGNRTVGRGFTLLKKWEEKNE